MRGGFLGVGMFFTLSGYLITSVLLREHATHKRIDLKMFWVRRARRLLPAAVLLIGAVLITTIIAEPANRAIRWRESVAALLYLSNWATIRNGVSYFARFGGPGPLDHLWSLAIEEQFYLVWPIVFVVLMWVMRGNARWAGGVALGLAAGSFYLLSHVAVGGLDNTRAYEGTDTRAGGILIGAGLAFFWRSGSESKRLSRRTLGLVDLVAAAAIIVIGWLVVTTDQYDRSIYTWRLLSLSLAMVVLIASVVIPGSGVARLFTGAPLRWVGERSYGVYLWHLPLAAFLPSWVLVEQPVARGIVVVALTLLLAETSWQLVENPIRVLGFVQAMRTTAGGVMPSFGAWAVTVGLGTSVLMAMSFAGQMRNAGDGIGVETPTERNAGNLSQIAVAVSTIRETTIRTTTILATTVPATTVVPATTNHTTVGPSTTMFTELSTACTSVAHIGDSTSIGLMSPQFLPDPELRIDAQYQRVGAGTIRTEISGARAIVETYKSEVNAEAIAKSLTALGHDGCWVFALGTNDSANSAAGSVVGAKDRIDRMMRAAHGLPVMWPTLKTLTTVGPYANASMLKFNAALLAACARYPNLRIYDWAGEVETTWYQRDGIHFTSQGYAERARHLARALAVAFPSDHKTKTCVGGS
jgi:peptidoglycan/LPS O-acetylase OafA/YrhL